MYEHRKQPLATRSTFFQRVMRNVLYTLVIIGGGLLIGTTGYHILGNAAWIDALHNSCMILGGMGSVIEVESTGGKLFSSFYALFSGIIFITNVSIVLAPAVHRLIHKLHLEE
ncbi:MAG: hypothetical protein RJA57_1108 [Bacteroidota bacterium]